MATAVGDLDLFTISDRTDFTRDAWREIVDGARRQHPFLMRTDIGYSITAYDDCVAIAFISQLQGVDESILGERGRPSILATEGDEHGRLRRLAAPAFTPKAADRMRPFMRGVIDRLVDEFVDAGHCEFISAVCEPYPIPVVCELLGAPAEDWRLFSRWATDLLSIFNGNLAEDAPRIASARRELGEYMRALIEERRAVPRDDLISDMIAVEQGNDRLTNEEVVSMAEAVLVAGTDTTRNQLGCALALFTEYPDQWELLRSQPDLAPRAVEETMRFLGAVRGTIRIASTDIEYKDVLFPAGTFVATSFVAGNFDESVWGPAAGTFDITRATTTSPHLTFGSGIHYCLGAWLARAELQEALPLLAARLGDMRVDGDITWKPDRFGIWGPETLPLRFSR
jgi:cytochrome P450